MLRSTLTLKVYLDGYTLSVSVCICLSLRVSVCFFVSLLISVCVCVSLFGIIVYQTSILNRLINCINASNFSTNKYFEHVVMYVCSTTFFADFFGKVSICKMRTAAMRPKGKRLQDENNGNETERSASPK